MNSIESIRPPASVTAAELAPARRATRLIFLLAGISLATWAPMVPFAKAHLQLNDAQLGLVLLGLGFGAMAVMPLAGFMTHRFGNRNVIGVSALLVCVALPLLTIAPTMSMLMAALLFFGAVHGVVDVAMNAHAVEVERRDVRPLMSGFHGLFSVGGLIGAAAMSGLLELGAPLLGCAIAVSVLLAIVVLTQWGSLLGGEAGSPDKVDTTAKKHSIFVMPSGIVFLLGFLCFISFMAEGSMLDWSAVFLRFSRGFDASGAGIGYAVFSVAMATGRLFGDRVTTRLGPPTIVRLGAILAAAGFLLATTLPWGWAALAGFVLVGLGSSNIVPVLFSAAGRVPGTSPGITIAAVTTLGYAGMLAAPAAIGYIAHATSLPLALSVIAVLLVVVAACAGIARR